MKAVWFGVCGVLVCAWAGVAGAEGTVLRTVGECERAAVRQHPSVRLAAQEEKVARFKRLEAARALWPVVALKAERTEGEAVRELGTPKFTEESYGVQLAQPLWQGGRLQDTWRQAQATWQAQTAKTEKARQEVLYNVREATWQWVRIQQSVASYRRAMNDVSADLTAAENLKNSGAISQQAYLTVVNQQRQSRLAFDSAKAEVEARLWQWTAALGLETPPSDPLDVTLARISTRTYTLEECLNLSQSLHPDMISQWKLAEAAGWGVKAVESTVFPKLSANGFYGRSGGAYNNEDRGLKEDWQAGLQLSQYFWGSTLSGSALKQRTSPKVGQTSRTGSTTYNGQVALADSLKSKTETAEADLARDQAKVQMERTRLEVANGVRETFVQLKKAWAQLEVASNDLELARTEWAVSKIKGSHREAPFSDRSVARNKLAQAEASQLEAQAGYHIAQAALARAVGDPYLFSEEMR